MLVKRGFKHLTDLQERAMKIRDTFLTICKFYMNAKMRRTLRITGGETTVEMAIDQDGQIEMRLRNLLEMLMMTFWITWSLLSIMQLIED